MTELREIRLTPIVLIALALVALLLGALIWVRRTTDWPYRRRTLLLNVAFVPVRIAGAYLGGLLRLVLAHRRPVSGTIGLIQYDGDRAIGQRDRNLQALAALADEAVAAGARVLVLPEGAIHGYGDATRHYWCRGEDCRREVGGVASECHCVDDVAEMLPDGPTTRFWTRFARERKVMVLFDLIERDGGRYHNTLAVVDATGLIARHRKVCLTPEDATYATPGDEATVIETPLGRFGLLVCNDSWVGRDLLEAYRAADVDGLIVSSYWHHFEPDALRRNQKRHFLLLALEYGLPVYVADHSFSDLTGLYRPDSVTGPARHGLPRTAIGVDGISLHEIPRAAPDDQGV